MLHFNPHGKTSNAVRVAIGYSLPDEQPNGAEYTFKNMHNQTYLANLSTMVVGSKSEGKNSTIKNWLLNSSEGAHAGHEAKSNSTSEHTMDMQSMENDEIINAMQNKEYKGSVSELLQNGAVELNDIYSDIDFNYFDIDADQRGEGGLLLSQENGDETLLHLTTADLNTGTGISPEYFSWAIMCSQEHH